MNFFFSLLVPGSLELRGVNHHHAAAVNAVGFVRNAKGQQDQVVFQGFGEFELAEQVCKINKILLLL